MPWQRGKALALADLHPPLDRKTEEAGRALGLLHHRMTASHTMFIEAGL